MLTVTRTFENNRLANFIKTCSERELAKKLHISNEKESLKKKALQSLLSLEPTPVEKLTEDIVREIRDKE